MTFKLSDKEKDILGHASLRADAPLSDIAADSGYPVHVVRRCLARLKEREIIRPVAVVNPYALGLRSTILFSP